MPVYDEPGLRRDQIPDGAVIRPLTAFRLALRTEPDARQGGTLDVYYDLVTDDPAYAHRIAVLPSRISPELETVVVAMQTTCTVAALIAHAEAELGDGSDARAERLREVIRELVRRAVIKGYVGIAPDPS